MAASTETENLEQEKQEAPETAETITKAEANKIAEKAVKKRLEREAKKHATALEAAKAEAVAEWREEQGLDDDKLSKLGEGEGELAKLQSENRKLKTAATKTEKALNALTDTHAKLMSSNKAAQINDAILREAAGKFVDPQDAVDKLAGRFAYDEGEHAAFITDEDGEPSALTAKDIVNELLESKPHLARPRGAPGAGSRVSPSPAGSDTRRGEVPTRDQRLKLLEGL
jgi:hypothetical protein